MIKSSRTEGQFSHLSMLCYRNAINYECTSHAAITKIGSRKSGKGHQQYCWLFFLLQVSVPDCESKSQPIHQSGVGRLKRLKYKMPKFFLSGDFDAKCSSCILWLKSIGLLWFEGIRCKLWRGNKENFVFKFNACLQNAFCRCKISSIVHYHVDYISISEEQQGQVCLSSNLPMWDCTAHAMFLTKSTDRFWLVSQSWH